MDVLENRSGRFAAAIALVLGALVAPPAQAADLLGLYLGGAAGRGRIEVGDIAAPPSSGITLGDLKANHSAYKLMAGIRPLPVIAFEAAYLDFGHPSGNLAGQPNPPVAGWNASGDLRLTGTAAYAIVYLPIPVVDVFAKAGLARLKSDATFVVQLTGPILCPTTLPACRYPPQSSSATSNGFTAGAGVGLKLGPFALRAEYERFATSGGAYPSLATLGITYTFL